MAQAEPESTRGNVGNEIFEQVERIVAEEGLTRTQAFQKLSEQTGRRAGTVAANYYRVARKRGAPLQPRRRRSGARGAARGGRRRASAGNADAALGRATEAIRELEAIVRSQERELASLREQAAVVDQLRRTLERSK
ncbi:MAG TPA: hypothetical protein VHK23_09605 [Miltoncostaeaceae bacterium]|nr:hypothetical protein [Miltoncostaeaceae bacterium]